MCVCEAVVRISSSFSVTTYTSDDLLVGEELCHKKKIKPYTPKSEPSSMATINELTLTLMFFLRSLTMNRSISVEITDCFSKSIVGLKTHNELAINS